MGQTIEILDQAVLGDTLVVSFDRSLSGQDGESFSSAPSGGETFPATLAGRLFSAGLDIDHVYVMSNNVSLRRPGGWDNGAAGKATAVISGFFRFYGTEEATEPPSSEEPKAQ